jgi:hypothetical protein
MNPSRTPPLRRILSDLPPVPLSDAETAWRRIEANLPRASHGIEGWLRRATLGLAVTSLAISLALVVVTRWHAALVKVEAGRSAEIHPLVGAVSLGADLADPQPLSSPAPVAEGSRIVTRGGEASLRIADGSRALVEPNSTLRVQRLEAGAVELDLSVGAVSVHAAHVKAGELAVRAGLYRVVVHGTSFRVVREADRLGVQLWHGSVAIEGESGSRMLQPSEQIWVADGQPLDQASVLPLRDPEASGWSNEDRPARVPSRPPSVTHETPAPAAVELHASRTTAARIHADVERCRRVVASPPGRGVLRLDLSVTDEGQVESASAEHGSADPKLASCLAEAALAWTLDAPPEALRGMQTRLQFVYPISLGDE